ncbi:crotonase/enoyl-CoA hydratase family protein [Haliangium ochraceum]|uniref:Enoyl-CoA hydratase/isomerase n=1 Tax=Haliangium ochraceum (strain DSM 14365 / JCM 11303 / SMP-2) TaxID=502025 RepID=D0LZJ4_HALO1|nr:crotonase/enoyl-CoA hydratase family protein [Haliangium ochraceum]ACY17973.1 Enoyl-CoA hydratase/isomerase [Haliangium ochraceum DSM 14365]
MTQAQFISSETRGHVRLIGLDRAAKRNAFGVDMLRELAEAYTAFEQDAELRCAVLFAHGDHFTGGLDLSEVGPAVAAGATLFPEGAIDPLDLPGIDPGTQRPRRSKPVVCAVQGWCLTIGIELLLASDIRVAARDTRFAQIEILRGIMPFGGATLRFPQIAGWGNAMRYLLTGDEFSAEEAYRIGLVQELVEPGTQLERALALAERVAAQAPLAVQASLASSREAVEQGPPAAIARLMERTEALMRSEDAAEGVRAFVERRPGRFQGK